VKTHFRCLGDWKIDYPSEKDTNYRAQCSRNNKHGVIYPWGTETIEPVDYIFHEQMHLALHELMNDYDREKEESIIQDVEVYIKNRINRGE